ncbi:MAG: 50S ribosomal protein L1 [Candidatus Omnitrophica bacterium]|nr:50S ribosomal protein L1 [Candidatus Omnitrophota bacterium]
MSGGKIYKKRLELIEKDKAYSLQEAIDILKSYPPIKFDETIEASGKLGIDPKSTDQMIRGAVVLPHGTGKESKVLVFCGPDKETEAKEAGADYIGNDEIVEKITKKGWVDFDSCISTPAMMKTVSKLGRFLGPRGLMPSPKTGSVTDNIAQAVEEAKKGKVNFRADKVGCLHAGIGKVSFKKEELLENIKTFVAAVESGRPQNLKGKLIKTFYLSTTMGPSVRVNL